MLVLLAALDWAIIHQRGLRFCYPISIVATLFLPTSSVAAPFVTPLLALPLDLRHKSVVQERLWCDHAHPGGAGTPRHQASNFLVFGAPASLIESELSGLLGSGPSLCLGPPSL